MPYIVIPLWWLLGLVWPIVMMVFCEVARRLTRFEFLSFDHKREPFLVWVASGLLAYGSLIVWGSIFLSIFVQLIGGPS